MQQRNEWKQNLGEKYKNEMPQRSVQASHIQLYIYLFIFTVPCCIWDVEGFGYYNPLLFRLSFYIFYTAFKNTGN